MKHVIAQVIIKKDNFLFKTLQASAKSSINNYTNTAISLSHLFAYACQDFTILFPQYNITEHAKPFSQIYSSGRDNYKSGTGHNNNVTLLGNILPKTEPR